MASALIAFAFALAQTARAAVVVLPDTGGDHFVPTSRQVFADEGAASADPATKGWVVNAWGSPSPHYEFSVISESPRLQQALPLVQSFRLIDAGGGGAQLARPFLATYGQTYALRVFLRAEAVPARATVALRRDGPYYESFGSRTVDLTTQWREVVVRGVYPNDDKAASARVSSLTPGAAIQIRSARLDENDAPLLAPRAASQRISPTFFGMVVNKLGVHHNWPGPNTKVIRLWDTGTTWNDIQPSAAVWRFERADLYVQYAAENRAQVLFTLGQTPAWAATDANQS